jgi:trehalose 6-phosphate phosphatase
MTKQSMVAPNTAPLLPYPPPRVATPGVAAERKKYLSQVDLAHARRSEGWVESMRASSPTHAKAAAADQEHAAWMVRCFPRPYLCFFRPGRAIESVC